MTAPPFRLRELRTRAGMTERQLAKKLGCHPNTVRFYEAPANVDMVSWTLALECAAALGCSLDELAGIDADESSALAIVELSNRRSTAP